MHIDFRSLFDAVGVDWLNRLHGGDRLNGLNRFDGGDGGDRLHRFDRFDGGDGRDRLCRLHRID